MSNEEKIGLNMTEFRQQILDAFEDLGGIATAKGIAKTLNRRAITIGNQLAAMNGIWVTKHPTSTGANTVWVLNSSKLSEMEISMPGTGSAHGLRSYISKIKNQHENDREEFKLANKAIRRQNARIHRLEERNNILQLRLIEETGYEAQLRRFYLCDLAEEARAGKCASERAIEAEAANRRLEDVMIIEGRESA